MVCKSLDLDALGELVDSELEVADGVEVDEEALEPEVSVCPLTSPPGRVVSPPVFSIRWELKSVFGFTQLEIASDATTAVARLRSQIQPDMSPWILAVNAGHDRQMSRSRGSKWDGGIALPQMTSSSGDPH